MSDLLRIAVRSVFAYVVLHQFLYHAGNRTVAQGLGHGGEGTGTSFVLVLIIGDMIDDLLWAEVPAAQFVVGCGALVLTHILVGMARRASTRWWRLTEGVPAPVLLDGVPQPRALAVERVNQHGLAALLRRRGIDRGRWTELRAAYLENSGRASVLFRPEAHPATRADRDRVRAAE